MALTEPKEVVLWAVLASYWNGITLVHQALHWLNHLPSAQNTTVTCVPLHPIFQMETVALKYLTVSHIASGMSETLSWNCRSPESQRLNADFATWRILRGTSGGSELSCGTESLKLIIIGIGMLGGEGGVSVVSWCRKTESWRSSTISWPNPCPSFSLLLW